MARLETSAEQPVPVRVVAQAIAGWINRLGEIWVEGQVAQLTRRPNVATQFVVLRDTDANISLTMTCGRAVLGDDVQEGARVVALVRPDFYVERGTLSLRASQVRQVGLGELLARLEALRRLLAAEGLFDTARKQALPFLPRQIGLITGRASAAEHDVVHNARRRFPAVRFRVEAVATQGTSAVADLVTALRRLDADPQVDVIVLARGGGSVEDLLPFSNESLLRAVAAARTPVVSAIGHESDRPLLDLVADIAASTPTDAAKRIVPDVADEHRQLVDLRRRGRAAAHRRLTAEIELIAGLPDRLRRDIRGRVERDIADVRAERDQLRRRLADRVRTGRLDVEQLAARLRALSPDATLRRGYAVVQRADGRIVRAPDEADGPLQVRVAGGRFAATKVGP